MPEFNTLRQLKKWIFPILLLWALFFTRVIALDAFPLHNDEGLHLTRAVEVWNLHPYWDISDGKIINHWAIALFYPQNAPDFVGRIATLFVAMLGFAAGYALIHHLFGFPAAIWGCILWLTAPYLFFFERLAQSDPEAGAWIVVTLWASILTAERGKRWHAVWAGLALAAAAQFKFTAAPYAVVVTLILLFWSRRQSYVRRIQNLVIAGLVCAVTFIPPLVYLTVTSDGFFEVARGWLGSNTSGAITWLFNLRILWSQLTTIGRFPVAWVIVVLGGIVLFALYGRWRAIFLLIVVNIPPALIVSLSALVLPRHFIVALPLVLLFAGSGIGMLLSWLRNGAIRWGLTAAFAILLSAHALTFFYNAYTSPETLELSPRMRAEYMTDHSSGFGLREAMLALPEIVPADAILIASMFPSSCRRANFYAVDDFTLTCVDAPGLVAIANGIEQNGQVFVLVEQSPGIGLVVEASDYQTEQIAIYTRPAGIENTTSIALWRLSR